MKDKDTKILSEAYNQLSEDISPEAQRGNEMVAIAFSIQDMNNDIAKRWANQKFIEEYFAGDVKKFSNWLNHAIQMER